MIVFSVAGGRFPLNPEPPQRKKTFHLGKVFNKNQTFDIQIAMSIALSSSITSLTKTAQKPSLWRGTYLYSLYKGEPPPGGGGGYFLYFMYFGTVDLSY